MKTPGFAGCPPVLRPTEGAFFYLPWVSPGSGAHGLPLTVEPEASTCHPRQQLIANELVTEAHAPLSTPPSSLSQKLLAALHGKIIITPALTALIHKGTSATATLEQRDALVTELVQAVWLFCTSGPLPMLRELESAVGGELELYPRDRVIPIVAEPSVVQARQETVAMGLKLGFGPLDRTKTATAASELSRNILMYARRGELRVSVRTHPRPGLVIQAVDQGPGISNVEEILSGNYRSRSGLGLGLRGVKTIAQEFRLASAPGEGTKVWAVFEPAQRKPQPTPHGGVSKWR